MHHFVTKKLYYVSPWYDYLFACVIWQDNL